MMASPIAILAALALAFIAAAAFALWIIGTRDRSRPVCRACGADARGRIWVSPVTCGGCNAPLSAPGAIRALKRQRPRLLLIVAACAMTLAVAILLVDRRLASVGMRWDATFIPVASDIATLRSTPHAAAGAVDRLWLRTIRGRLSPGEAGKVVDALLASPTARTFEGSGELLRLAGLRAAHISRPDQYVDEVSFPFGLTIFPLPGPIRPGGRFFFEIDGWGRGAYLIRSFTLDGRALELEGGLPLAEGRLVRRLDECFALLPESLPEGDHDVEILFDVVLAPPIGYARLRSAPEGASIHDLGVKLLRRERSHRDVLSIRSDGAPVTPSQARPVYAVFGDVDDTPRLPQASLFADSLTPRRLLVIAGLAGILLPLVLLCILGILRLARGPAILIVPRCAACRSALHERANRCTECGLDLRAPHAVRALAFHTSALRVALVCLAAPIIACALLICTVMSFTPLDRRFGSLPREDMDLTDQLDIETRRFTGRGVDDAAVERLKFLLMELRESCFQTTSAPPDWTRVHRILRQLLAQLEQRPLEAAAVDRLLDPILLLLHWDPDPDADLRDAFYHLLVLPVSLEPLRHRAGTWSEVNLEELNYHGPSHRLLSIEGVPHHMRRPEEYKWIDEILVPEALGPFEITLTYGGYDENDGIPRTQKVIRMESVAPGEPVAHRTTDPLYSPFGTPPALVLHQVDDRPPPQGRWLLTMNFEQPRLRAKARGSWSIESVHGTFPIELKEEVSVLDLDPDLLGPPGTPVTLHFEPLSLDELDPDEVVIPWGAAQSWHITPELRPLGWWDGRWWSSWDDE